MVNRLKASLALITLAAGVLLSLGDVRLSTMPASAQDRSPLSRWKSRDYAGLRYVGSKVCAECHEHEARTQLATPMAHALEPASGCGLLASGRRLEFADGPYVHRLTREGGRPVYTVTDGKRAISEPVLYCFGQGEVGQTYVFMRGGKLYESRVSYYRGIDGLDITVAHPRLPPTSLEDALGRPVGREEARGCFGCHSPEAVGKDELRVEGFDPGVTCESCHGPGERHVLAARRKDLRDPQVFNPGDLSAQELSQEFCGSCHVSFEQAMIMPRQGGANNIRFQAYRIFNSPGHRGGDARISCVACHDPHRDVERGASRYDSKCLACHASDPKQPKTKERPANACPVARAECAKCHMPKVELPDAHARFTDHWIRTVRPGDQVPH
jgi:hypothetical protein